MKSEWPPPELSIKALEKAASFIYRLVALLLALKQSFNLMAQTNQASWTYNNDVQLKWCFPSI